MIAAVLALLLLPMGHLEAEFGRCVAISDSLLRLRCYDELSQAVFLNESSNCPLRVDLEPNVGRFRTGMFTDFDSVEQMKLNDVYCAAFPHVHFIRAGSRWTNSTMTLFIEARNDYPEDRTVFAKADFELKDGRILGGGFGSANVDSEETSTLMINFKIPISKKLVKMSRVYLNVIED